jgi:methylated-DNA-[protein]-cysteine S-methyltransferase
MKFYTTIDSPVGQLTLVGEESATASSGVALNSLSMPEQKGGVVVDEHWTRNAEAFADVAEQIDAYFAGELTEFTIETTTHGTSFQQTVWQALESIPYGTTISYGQFAERIGASRAAVRAVGTAIGANPLLLVRPCHRIIGADGALRGYAAGLDRKRQLLVHEGAMLSA